MRVKAFAYIFAICFCPGTAFVAQAWGYSLSADEAIKKMHSKPTTHTELASDTSSGTTPSAPSLSLEQMRKARQPARDKSILQTHAYDRNNTTEYLLILNRQLVAIEALEMAVNEYKRVRNQLFEYNSTLDKCLTLAKSDVAANLRSICDKAIAKDFSATSGYYDFVELIGGMKNAKMPESISDALQSLKANLGALVDAAAVKETSLGKTPAK